MMRYHTSGKSRSRGLFQDSDWMKQVVEWFPKHMRPSLIMGRVQLRRGLVSLSRTNFHLRWAVGARALAIRGLEEDATPSLGPIALKVQLGVVAARTLLLTTQLFRLVHAKIGSALASRHWNGLGSATHARLKAHHGSFHLCRHGLIDGNCSRRGPELVHVALVPFPKGYLHELRLLPLEVGFKLRVFALLQLSPLVRLSLLLGNQLGHASLFVCLFRIVRGNGNGVFLSILLPLLLRRGFLVVGPVHEIKN
ncbi:hypothetical protein PsorP6_016826 [Peronosclerospora sorghi]|uniref:Uncharacterized protein n=1 Tax=Peronosclerospora sorghi TaxID=230839 RepID=A0ACC0WEU0_9STRA|nr:hypothetical protein PsorP6_016826 [Peronosclerospora sorghi]